MQLEKLSLPDLEHLETLAAAGYNGIAAVAAVGAVEALEGVAVGVVEGVLTAQVRLVNWMIGRTDP